MKKKLIAFLLCLSLLLALPFPGAQAVTDNGMVIDKTATANDDGTYTITLEAYATGQQVTTTVNEDVPTDIILVLDQSGSMAYNIGEVSYRQYTGSDTENEENYDNRHNGGKGNLWHRLGDGSYVSVSVTRTRGYAPLEQNLKNKVYYNRRNNLYEKIGDEFKKVDLTRIWDWGENTYQYTYTFSDGTSLVSKGENTVPDLGTHAPLYTPNQSGPRIYTYTYTDAGGNTQLIGNSTGDDTPFTPAFYQRQVNQNAGGTRLAALKAAVTTFANSVAEKAAGPDGNINTTDDNVNHRIAVVGFASEGGYGNNTELLSIAGRNSGSVGIKYSDITGQNYKDVLQNMDTAVGKQMVTSAINALAAEGATRTDLGVVMANGIFANNPISEGEQRNRVIIVFTDGSPTDHIYFNTTVANNAIAHANTAKGTHGATVYTVGIFSGADATTAGNVNGNETAKANWFMQQVSSNNGSPRTPSYYLSAADAGSLNNIFQQISSQIQSGGTTATLNSQAVVRDMIAPSFELTEGTDVNNITLETYRYTGENTWSINPNAMGATPTVDGNQISVTGFNFSENWCGTVTQDNQTIYRGNKLVIKFDVVPRAGFLGGNNVPTNASAGIYESAEAAAPVVSFPVPEVNVPIPEVTVTAQDKNVYLHGSVTSDQLKTGATAIVGDPNNPVATINLDPSATNFGLEAWQNAYVDIDVSLKDQNSNPITGTGPTGLTGDTTYTLELEVSPKTGPVDGIPGNPAERKTGSDTGNINVFKPELTFSDSEVYYGESVPADNDYGANKVGPTLWKYGDTLSTSVIMTGEEPTLSISYTPDSNKISDGKYTKQDVPVKVDVTMEGVNGSINQYTTFVHQNCNIAGCNWSTLAHTLKNDPAFLLHVKTCSLTIQKTGGDTNEPYVFTVNKDGVEYTQVTVKGGLSKTIYELPVGTYSITEDDKWSWRYTPRYSDSVTLSSQNPRGELTCTNSLKQDKEYWLNGYSDVVPNIYGGSGNATTAGNVG